MPKFEMGTCNKCNNQNGLGRLVVREKGSKSERHEYWCFDCWEEEKLSHMTFVDKKFSSWVEANYNQVVREYHTKPKFYGEEPNNKKIEEAAQLLLNKE